jgi:TRAP-type C4-dicarboxylate transport system permease small subunit
MKYTVSKGGIILNFRSNFTKIVDIIGTVIFAVIIVVSSAQIVNRYIFGKSLFWAEELSVQLMIWITFLGAAKGVSLNSHTRLTVLLNALAPGLRNYMMLVSNLLCIAFLGISARYGFVLAKNTWNSTTIGTRMPLGFIYLAMPLCSVLIIVFLIMNSMDTILELRKPHEAKP